MTNKYFKLIKVTKNFHLVVVSGVVGLIVLAVFGFESFYSYRSEVRSAQIQSANLTQVLEEQILTSFQKIDLELLELLSHFQLEKSLTKTRSHIYNQWLLERKSRLGEVLSFKVVDENGEFIGDDIGVLSKSNLRDREYFQTQKSLKKNAMFISKPVISKTAHVWVVVISRPILSPEGQFRGLILGTIPLSHYRKMFEALDIGNGGVINLFGFDYTIFARKPWVDKHIGKPATLSSQLDLLINSSKTVLNYTSTSPLDGVKRVLTARKMANYPFVVTTGLAMDDFLFSWKIRTTIYFFFIIFLFTGFSIFLFQFLQSLQIVEEQRRQSIQAAKLTSLGEMASGIAHEINNPLAIIAATSMILKRPKSDSESDIKLNDSLDRIIKTVDRIAKIIRGLHAFSRDSFDDPAEKTSVQNIITGTLDLCAERLKKNNIELKINCPEQLFVIAREVQISQVIMNLLNNSLDALDKVETKWIQLDVSEVKGMIMIRVTDSGSGIPEDIAEKIMQPFFTTKDIGKGTGLGLSISKGIVEGHHGKFYLDRKADHTSFVIELPKAS